RGLDLLIHALQRLVDRFPVAAVPADHAGSSVAAADPALCRLVLLHHPLLLAAVAARLLGDGYAFLSPGGRDRTIDLQLRQVGAPSGFATLARARYESSHWNRLAHPAHRNVTLESCMAGYRIVIADDHPLFRGALRQALCDIYPDVRIEEAGSLDDVVAVLENGDEPDLILLDLMMPGVQGFSGLMYLRAQYPGIPAVVVSANEDAPVIRRSLDFGASGFVPKSAPVDEIRSALAAVLDGEVWVPAGIDLSEDRSEEHT